VADSPAVRDDVRNRRNGCYRSKGSRTKGGKQSFNVKDAPIHFRWKGDVCNLD
jgi:hypothetical protein